MLLSGVFYFYYLSVSLAHAENCDVLNGQWEIVKDWSNNCGNHDISTFNTNISSTGKSIKLDELIINSSTGKVTKDDHDTGNCSMSGSTVSIKAGVLFLYSIEFSLNLSPDKMSFEGNMTGDDCGLHAKITGKRISALPRQAHEPIKGGGGEARDCIDKDYANSSKGFKLKNICKVAVNLKFTFSKSKPFSDVYTTLQPNESTFSDASEEEQYVFYSCFSPNIPQTINGACADLTSQKTYTKSASGNGEAKDCVARSYTQGEEKFQFINTCPQSIVIKYQLSKSKPSADGYLILPSGALTSEKASDKEHYNFAACYTPNLPVNISGKCANK